MVSIAKWLLVVVLAVQLAGSGAARKKKRHKKSASKGSRDEVSQLTGGIYEQMQQVREKTASPAVQKSFVRNAKKSLREFEEANGQFAPDLGPTYEVTEEDIQKFRDDGYVVLRGVFTPEEISFYREVILHTMNTDVHYLTKRPGFLRVYNLWDKHPLAKKFVLSERLGRVAADLLRSDGVRLYQDQTFYKFPGDGESPLHQDNYAAPIDSNETVSAWIPLVECTQEMGALEFVVGSHREGLLGHGFNYDQKELEAQYGPLVKPTDDGPLKLGDITLHNGWTIHRADPNRSRGPNAAVREAVAIQLFADGTRRNSKPTQSGSYRHDANSMSRWANDFRPGEVIDHYYTPLLFSHAQHAQKEL